jgi:hypothetical protein
LKKIILPASSDTQTIMLAGMKNTFEEENRVRCFNHTLQLSATTLTRPFNAGMTSEVNREADGDGDDLHDVGEFEADDDDDDDEGVDEGVDMERDDVADDIDEFEELNAADKETFLGDTADVRSTVSKVSSTTE